ncbi:MAG: hypothetical protein K9N05_01510 [Candidatus Marinimicrobia bacterium]|nr:hypothetical protein [Candidatus Neomarinimicrobiota bacterium]
MKHICKLKKDSIIREDKRFDYKALKEHVIENSPNTLPLLWGEDGRWIPVYAIDEISENISEIDALTYRDDSSYEDVLWDVIKRDNVNIFDIARVIILLEEYAPAYDKKLWARRLKIGVDQWDNISALNDFDIEWTSFFLHKNVPLKRVLHFSDHEVRILLKSILTLNPGINVLESIADLLSEVAHRDKVTKKTIWEKLKIPAILENAELQSTLKLQNIRTKLYEVRFPTIARYRKHMNELLDNIPKSAGIALLTDQDFETPGMRLQADVRSGGDIEKLQYWLEEQKTDLEKIIEIQKGKDGDEQEQ